MQSRNPAEGQDDWQARIRELEQELDIKSDPEVELIRLELIRLGERIELLSAQHREIQEASGSMPSQEQREELAAVVRQLWQAIQDVRDTNEKLSARFPPPRRRGVNIQVHAEARNRWLMRVRRVKGHGGEERVREFHVVGRRHRKFMKFLENRSRRPAPPPE